MSKIKKPAIRFDSFVEEWEQRKVGELLIERNEQAPMSKEYPLMAFIANEGVAPKGDRYDRSSLVSDVENKLYKKRKRGTLFTVQIILKLDQLDLINTEKPASLPSTVFFNQLELLTLIF